MKSLKEFFSGPLDAITMSEQLTERLPPGFKPGTVRRKLLDVLLTVGIPFNRWLGYRIKEFGPSKVVVKSPSTTLRRNHVGTAHACALALLGEYPAGLLVAQRFPLETYRFIISKLEIDYEKAARGTIFGTAMAPAAWPELVEDEGWVSMETQITDEGGDRVATCKTHWQVKSWKKIESDRVHKTKSKPRGAPSPNPDPATHSKRTRKAREE